METKMKRIAIQFFSMLAVMLAFAACNNDDTDPNDYYHNMTIGDVKEADGNSLYIDSDKGNKLLIQNSNELTNHDIKAGDRLYAEFLMSDKHVQGYNNVMDVTYFYKVLTKDPVALTADNVQEIGDDKIAVTDIWCSKDYLNIQFQFFTDGTEAHLLNLVTTTDIPENSIDSNYAYVEFRHNSKNDANLYPYNGIVSFRLDNLKKDKPNLKGLIVRVRTYNDGERLYKVNFTAQDGSDETQSPRRNNLSEVTELAN